MASVIGWIASTVFLVAFLAVGYFVLATQRIAARAERLVPASGNFVDIGGNRIHYLETGEGRPIVFVHGLGGQLHHFRYSMFPLLTGYRLIALDRPGSGYSVRAAGATARLPEQAEVIVKFIEALGLEKPLLVGHSLGGAVALDRCAQPSRCDLRHRGAGAADAYGRRDQGRVQKPVHHLEAQALADRADDSSAGIAEICAADARFRLRPAAMAGGLYHRRRRHAGAEAEPHLRDGERHRRNREGPGRDRGALRRDQNAVSV